MRRTLFYIWCFERGFGRYDLLPPSPPTKVTSATGCRRQDRHRRLADYALSLSDAGVQRSLAMAAPSARAVTSCSPPAGMRKALTAERKSSEERTDSPLAIVLAP